MFSAAGELTAVCKGQHDWMSAQWGTDLTSNCISVTSDLLLDLEAKEE